MSARIRDQRSTTVRSGSTGSGHDAGVATLATATRQPGDSLRVQICRNILQSRRMLGDLLDPTLFANPGLDIMLFLFAEGLNGATVTTNACCLAAGVPRTTALRWIKLLQDRRLIDGSDDLNDRRVTMLALTPMAREKIRTWLVSVAQLPEAATRPDR